MPKTTFMGSLSSPKVEVLVDTGNPLLNHTLDGFLKIGTVCCCCESGCRGDLPHGQTSVSKHSLQNSLEKMCKEGAYWGTIAGVYVGMEYGVERVRGTRDWKNAMIGGALTGALVSAVGNNKGDKIIMDAITGGAVATAAEFISYLT
ncbi:hypothetical protein HanIR_Chr06g0280191 [Helianthus annuus]|nr:hypothetical protein HanIR_Chr06g0280191 [Helianthus annuus]KAJ0738032.1 hypothetical protein HanLR1_Chr06g0213511 [Helianthus annuus]